MKYYYIAIIPLLIGCSATKKAVVEVKEKDSARVEIRYEKVFVPDTIYIELPEQKAEITTKKRESHLENTYAVSDAKINDDYSLFHTLELKQVKIPHKIDKVVERKDSIIYKTKDKMIVKEVKAKLNKWQKTQIIGFWLLLAFAIYKLKNYFLKVINIFKLN